MKRLFTLFLCTIYTFVAFGGSIFMHNCGENTVYSIYQKTSHEECPICGNKSKTTKKQKVCTSGSCKDVEVKIDQLADELFSANKAGKFLIQPHIFQRLWVEIAPVELPLVTDFPKLSIDRYYSSTAPPRYLLNCNFRN